MSKFHAGYDTFRATDEDGSLVCALWYPTETEAKTFVQGVYDLHCAKRAPCASGSFPIVMMSHGSGGTRMGSCKTAEFLAENGFIVLAPEHIRNNFFDDSGTGSAAVYSARSRHMKTVLDAFIADKKWSASVDPENIAIFGFSLGGYTALTCVGAQPYVKGLRHHIRANREFDPLFSGYEVIVRDGYDEDYLPVTVDPRYKACIALAPVSGGLFPADSLKDITIPVQIFRAERDMVLRHPFHAEEIKQNLPGPCDYHVTPNAGHFSYLSPMRDEVKAEMGELANDSPDFDRFAAHDAMHHLILDFLHKALS